MKNRRMSSALPPSPIPLFNKAAAFREWRKKAFFEGRFVGYVLTMAALHEGHLSLTGHKLAGSSSVDLVLSHDSPSSQVANRK
jgi:pantoate--beta-alanine ligase